MENKTMNKRSKMESEFDMKDIIVIDNGSDSVKIGISGENFPKLIIPSVAGIPEIKVEQGETQNKTDASQALFGNHLKQAQEEGKFQITEKKPIMEGRIQEDEGDEELMKELWKYALDTCLQVNEIQSQNLLIIDQPHNDKDYKHKIANIFFEELKVNSILFMNSATLSLFSTGCTTGLVVESGHAITSVVPIFEGFPMQHAIAKSTIAGEQMTSQLNTILKGQGIDLPYNIVKDIKEKKCMVARDYNIDVKEPNLFDIEEKSYELPDGTVIEIDNQARYTTTEIIFNPTIINDTYSKSITDMMLDSLQRCDVELQAEMYNNIVLCGGSSLFRGFKDRISDEILSQLPPGISKNDVNFVENLHRRHSAWIGGSMLGSLSTFQNLAITRSEYEENPENKVTIIHRRTF